LYFFGPLGSQAPLVVGAAIAHAITKPISNRNANTKSEKNTKEFVVDFREALGDLFDTAADVDAHTHAFRAMCAELVQ
jgi:hypothetical protein